MSLKKCVFNYVALAQYTPAITATMTAVLASI